MYGHAFNPPLRPQAPDPDTASALAWVEQASLPVSQLGDPRVIQAALDGLCTRLDGLPLAIELAAHQLRVLPPERLIERLDERLDDRLAVLVGGARDGFGRHRSLRAAIEWSYELLTGTEQAVFRRLAVPPGGFEETTAAVVCADTGAGADLWATVTALVDKSMLVADPLTPGRALTPITIKEKPRLPSFTMAWAGAERWEI